MGVQGAGDMDSNNGVIKIWYKAYSNFWNGILWGEMSKARGIL